MSNFNPPFPGPVLHEARPNNQHRHSGDFRAPPPPPPPPPGGADGNAPVPVPAGAAQRGMNGNSGRAMAGFDDPRSPPNNKSTAHVPCKFFRQGTCQAGKACPFMHSNEPTTEVAPCKYFQKGNCKFGAKCALAHILPDGRRVNKPSHLGMGGGYNLGGRMNIPPNEVPPGSASLLSMQMPGPQQQFGFSSLSDEYFQAQQQQRSAFDNIPTIDTTFSSHPGSNYGSPPNENRLGISPVQKGLSVMDAPLPASFDSQGISHIARYGPMAKSVPSRFGFDISPPSSLPKPAADSRTLQNLHNSAFGDDNRATRNGFGSSPPQHDDFPGRRIMHSDRLTRPNMLSSSLDTRKIGRATMSQDEWDENFAFEEDLVPTALHDLLTEKEKMRRFSRTEDDTFRHSLSGLGTPTTTDSHKLGSSPKVGSPSRFSALFARQAHKSEHHPAAHHSSDIPPPGFGHVGSPLRNSSLHPGASPAPRAIRATSSSSSATTPAGDLSPFLASPPRQASMSIISQQLQRTRLSSRAGSSSHIPDAALDTSTSTAPTPALHPGLARAPSASSASPSSAALGGAPSSAVRTSLDRAASSGSVARSERIDEEQGLFRMEDEEEILERRKLGDAGGVTPTSGAGAGKRFSGGWGAFAGLGASPGAGGRKEGAQVGLGTSPGTIGGHRISSGKEGGSGAGVKEGAGGVWGNGSGSGSGR